MTSLISLFSSLISSLPFWEDAEYLAAAIVVCGAVGEFLTEFEYVFKGDDNEESRHRFGKYAALLLIIGLGIELGALVRTNQLSSSMLANLYKEASDAEEHSTISDERAKTAFDAARAAQERADKAEEQAGSAIGRAAANAREAARLNKVAQDEALARAKIEEQVAWRKLSSDQIENLCPMIRSLPSGIVKIENLLGDVESQQYMEQFVFAFNECGSPIKPEDIGSGVFTGSPPQGVLVVVESPYDPIVKEAAAVLEGLKSAKIDAQGTSDTSVAPGKIELVIGVKAYVK